MFSIVSVDEPHFFEASLPAREYLLASFAHAHASLGPADDDDNASGPLTPSALSSPERHHTSDVLQTLGECEQVLLLTDPQRALAVAEQIIINTWPADECGIEKVMHLHCLCADAWMELEQPARALQHFSRLQGPTLGGQPVRLPLDAQIVHVCAMLVQR